MSRTGTSSQTQSRFLKKHRLKPYHRSSAPYDEHIRTGIKNQENLIRTFYTNAAISIEKERIEIKNKLKQLYTKLSDNQKEELKQLTQLRNANDLNEIEGMLIEIEKRSDSISLRDSPSVQNLEYKKALLLIIICYKLKEMIIKSDDILSKLLGNKEMSDKEYIEYLNAFFNSFEKQPYFRLLNIRGFYKDTLRGKLDDSIDDKSYIAYLALYSKFLFEYATIINTQGIDDLKYYLYKTEGFIEKHLKANIYPNYYKQYYASPEHSGGRRSKKSKAPLKASLKAIKELCKANQIKLSRIIDGKRVAYKKSELITKLKRRKIRIPIRIP
jgi:hypothetical protein